MSRLDSRLTALERLIAKPSTLAACGECGQIRPPRGSARDADEIRERILRRLDRLAGEPISDNSPLAAYVAHGLTPPLERWPRCGTCGLLDSRAMRRQMQGSHT